MKPKHYDAFIIGSGIAGQTVAETLAKEGLKVAIADNREYGGTCANRGCDPKKILLQYADLIHYSQNLKNSGIKHVPQIDWKAVQAFKSLFTEAVPKSTEENLRALGVSLYHQSPEFVDQKNLSVEGKPVTADYIVIATGMVPRKLDIPGNELLVTSDEILDLKELPKSITFFGSGYVGMEFAYLMSTLDVQVTMIDRGTRPLHQFDEFLVDELTKCMEDIGVQFIFNAEVQSVEKLRVNKRVTYTVQGKNHEHDSGMVVNTAGRVPSLNSLNLEKGNIDFNDKGVKVNSYLQSVSNKAVFSCGDVSSASLPLTPLSGLQGYIVANNILNSKSKEFQNPLVPSTVFTQPNISSVGLSESEAKRQYKEVNIFKGQVGHWFNTKKQRENGYAYKILVNGKTNKFLGAHLLSPQANEDINIFTTAMNADMTVDDFKKLIFTYPSFANDLKSMLKNPD